MSDSESVTYICHICGYTNTWTRNEILQKGKKELYRGEEVRYSLQCKNPSLRPSCEGRNVVALQSKDR